MRKVNLILSLIICLSCATSQAEENFPFLGVVTAKNVNVRAGEDKSFERIHRLQAGDKIVVVGRSYSWYKIKLPVGASCYVDGRYIRPLTRDIGEITGNRVNIRAKAGEQFSVIGQLNEGTKVRTKRKKNGWVRIEPVEGVYGWIKQNFVAFRSQGVPPPKVVQEPTRNIYVKARQRRELEKQQKAEEEKRLAKQSVVMGAPADKRSVVLKSIVVTGTLMKIESDASNPTINHQLVVNEQKAYYLQAPKSLMDRFHKHKVKVEGFIKENTSYQYYPIIKVHKVGFIL